MIKENKFYLIFLILNMFFCLDKNSAQNLIPNPSFEDTLSCPTTFGAFDLCVSWIGAGYSPDLLNECSPTAATIPNCGFGFQYAHSGQGMAGIAIWRREGTGCGNCREYIGCNLIQPLQIGVKYYISFYVNYSYYQLTNAVASNNIGLNFYNQQYDHTNFPPLTNSAIVNADSIISDSLNWIKIRGSFIADSSYTYIFLGNFFDNANTFILPLSPIPDASYYYIDDVCVTTDSIYNEIWTNLRNDTQETAFSYFPNPVINELNLISKREIVDVQIFNYCGQEVLNKNIYSKKTIIDFEILPSGIYFIKVMFYNFSKCLKIYKN